MENWKKRYIVEPPICSILEPVGLHNSGLKLKLTSCQDHITELESHLTRENQVLHKMIYKYVGPFRREKLLGLVRKVYKCVNRYREISISKYLRTVLGIIGDSDGKRLPSIAMVNHLLSLLLRGCLCLKVTVESCLYGYSLVQQKYKIGSYVPTMLLFTAVLARIWFLSCALLKELTDFYDAVIMKWSSLPDWEEQGSVTPNRPQSIKYLCPVYKHMGQGESDLLTSLQDDEGYNLNNNPQDDSDDGSDVQDVTVPNKGTNQKQKSRNNTSTNRTDLFLAEDMGVSVQRKSLTDMSLMEDMGVAIKRISQTDTSTSLKQDKGVVIERKNKTQSKSVKQVNDKTLSSKKTLKRRAESEIKTTEDGSNMKDSKRNKKVNVSGKISTTTSDDCIETTLNTSDRNSKNTTLGTTKNCTATTIDTFDNCKNVFVCKDTLKKLSLNVYQKKKVCKRVIRVLSRSECVLKLRDCEVRLPVLNCQKVINDICKQTQVIKDTKGQNNKAAVHKLAAGKLLKQMEKFVVTKEICKSPNKPNPVSTPNKPSPVSGTYIVKVPKKNMEEFVSQIIRNKAKRKDFALKLKKADLELSYGKKRYQPNSDWFKNVNCLFKQLSRDLKNSPEEKKRLLEEYSCKVMNKIKEAVTS